MSVVLRAPLRGPLAAPIDQINQIEPIEPIEPFGPINRLARVAPLGASLLACALIVGFGVGCSGSSANEEVDAADLCWPGGGTPTEGASVELGVGVEDFAPIEGTDDPEVVLTEGRQGASHMVFNARIEGMEPGDPDGPPEGNPTTRLRAFLDTGEEMTLQECTFPLAYRDSPFGGFELPSGRLLQIRNLYVPAVYDQRIRILVEVLDPQGRYASDERMVIVLRADGGVDAGVPDAGLADAGLPDAGI